MYNHQSLMITSAHFCLKAECSHPYSSFMFIHSLTSKPHESKMTFAEPGAGKYLFKSSFPDNLSRQTKLLAKLWYHLAIGTV